ncbi:hypothetical protein [Vreelandella janggokensis]|uniref:hypothetical protein n=1 Tax=Vreelandella janggokensis TaxID=370767 RepID=UPI002856FADE|nr:hypothetical protein [Halomonas janggokensis]MDR5887357.1 hypothetical protein [Halomonas janggokensis]
MKVIQIDQAAQQDACLARLCAEVYGQSAGLTPLVIFTGTRNVLLAEEAARLVAAVDGEGKPQALALLVLDEEGEGMALTHACDLAAPQAKAWLVNELALKAPLRVDASDAAQEAFYQQCGIKRWLDGAEGQRIGLGARHPANTIEQLTATVTLDEALILRRFKHDPAAFEQAKQLFVDGLAHFPEAF